MDWRNLGRGKPDRSGDRSSFVVVEESDGTIVSCREDEAAAGSIVLVAGLSRGEARKFAAWHRELMQTARRAGALQQQRRPWREARAFAPPDAPARFRIH